MSESMTDETRKVLDELLKAATHLRSVAPPQPPKTSGLVNRTSIATAVVATVCSSFVLVMVQSFFYGGPFSQLAKHVDSAMASSMNNASEIRRVEADSKYRDERLGVQLEKWADHHMQYEHPRSGRRSSSHVNGWHPPLRLVGIPAPLRIPVPVQTPWRR